MGDGADGRPQTQQVSDLIAGMNPNMFLYLGDVYEKGSAAEFQNYYAAQFGRFDSISNPTIGNHEYSSSSTAEGYFRYWRSPPNYYSYDAGGWHFVSLNSDDHFDRSVSGVRQTQPGTGGVRTMYDWLADDLAAHPTCTIVYYHHPLWNQGEESPSSRMSAIGPCSSNSTCPWCSTVTTTTTSASRRSTGPATPHPPGSPRSSPAVAGMARRR